MQLHIWLAVPFIFLGIIFYSGRRGQQAFAQYIPPGYIKVYWCAYLLFASSFLWSRSLAPGSLSHAMTWVGAYSTGFLFYAFFILIIIDILRVLNRWLRFIPQNINPSPARTGLMVILLLAGLLVYGSWNARNPVFISYEITIPKNTAGNEPLHAILISDLHLGKIVGNDRLAKAVESINRCNPDLVLIAGDLIDGDIIPFQEQNMGATLRRLKPKLGTYMVLGNHDGHGEEVIPYFQAAGITVLNNKYQLVDNRFYLLGRDYGGHQGLWSSPPELADTMAGMNKQLPIIFLNHSPTNLEEARINGVDLQLSGHTHQGQLFPNNFITGNMYEIDWGYLRKGRLQVIVSTGVGTWGPPIRIGNTPEIVDLTINFK